jgi:glycerol kinase
MEPKQLMSQAGWIEHNAMEIWDNAHEVVGQALGRANISTAALEAVAF